MTPLRVGEISGRDRRRRSQVSVSSIVRSELDEIVRRLRSSAAWKRARRARLAIDGHRCTFVDPRTGTRCSATGTRKNPLDVHHLDQLRSLVRAYLTDGVERADEWAEFVRAATDVDRLRTLCRSHHPKGEREARELAKGDER